MWSRDKPIQGVRIAGRAFKKDQALAARAQIAWAINKADEVTLAPDSSLHHRQHELPADHAGLPTSRSDRSRTRRRATASRLRSTPAKNTGHEASISPNTRPSALRSRSPCPGSPAVLGVWAKGNSNWGQIRFEIEDAQGEVFKNETTGPSWGCNIMDWPGNLGRELRRLELHLHGPEAHDAYQRPQPGDPSVNNGFRRAATEKIDFPIKVRAITVGMNRIKLDLLDFKPSVPAIRLKDVGGVEDVSDDPGQESLTCSRKRRARRGPPLFRIEVDARLASSQNGMRGYKPSRA